MFGSFSYIPSIAVRPSEIEGVRRLPDNDKDALLASIRLRKWHNSASLDNSFNAITSAFGDRMAVLDLDARPVEVKNACDAQLVQLADPTGGHATWAALLQSRTSFVPTLQWGGTPQQTQQQATALLALGRGLAIKLRKATQWNLIDLAHLSAVPMGSTPVLLVLEFGAISSQTDLTGAAAELSGVASAALAMISSSDITITTAASSFPAEFASINREHARLPIRERSLFSLLSAAPVFSNDGPPLRYGDFASVCVSRGNFAQAGAPRIDPACRNEWAYYRREDDQSYVAAAGAVMADNAWRDDIVIWGTNEIRRAATGDLENLHYPRRWVTVRINSHIHQQIHYGSPDSITATDEPWQD